MSLLVLTDVTKRYEDRRAVTAVDHVSLDVASGEVVTVWGPRRSGRTTLLRVAAGITQPDCGRVEFDGTDLARASMLGTGIGWCTPKFDVMHGRTVLDHVSIAARARRTSPATARAAATAALQRVGAADIAEIGTRELHPHERVRAGIARALVTRPRLLILDDPALEVGYAERDAIHRLIASLAADGAAILVAVTEAMIDVDRILTLHDGRLHGEATPSNAPVLPLVRAI